MSKYLIHRLRETHDRLNCMVDPDGRRFKSDEQKQQEISEAMDLCWKAADVLDATLTAALAHGEPVGWETPEEWELEQRVFHRHAAPREELEALIEKLWEQYCLAARPAPQPSGPVQAGGRWLKRLDGDTCYVSLILEDGKATLTITVSKPHWSDVDTSAAADRILSALTAGGGDA